MRNLFKKKMPGIKLHLHGKRTKDSIPTLIDIPELVKIPMSMHIGAPCVPQVKIGDTVQVGQIIGDSDAFVSAPIHASVSGTVTAMEEITYSSGIRTTAVVIQSDGQQTLHESVQPHEINSREEFIAAVRASGLVGLGGAGFPTHVKMAPKNPDAIDTLIVNGAECEPFITSDYRIMMDDAEQVIDGIELIQKYLNIKECIIAIEDDKMEAVHRFLKLTANKEYIRIFPMNAIYPRGAEKVITYEATGRVIPQGKLPADVGVLVSNIRTVSCISRYIRTGLPLVQKTVTVDGSAVDMPQNVVVPIGTRISDVIAYCGGYSLLPRLLLMGGPMMGISLYTDDYPVLKNNNAILAFAEKEAVIAPATPCIRCGSCVRACPVDLMPLALERAVEKSDADELRALHIDVCMECGCCSFVCPSKRPLVVSHQMGKALLRAQT